MVLSRTTGFLSRLALAGTLLVTTAPSWAAVQQNYERGTRAVFPETDFVARQVRFWEAIFGRYGDKTVLVHDAFHPDVIIDIVDLDILNARAANENGNNTNNANESDNSIDDSDEDANTRYVLRGRQTRDKIANRYLERYQLAMDRFRSMGSDALQFGAMEKRVYNVYRRNPVAYADLMAGRAKARLQSGLKDEFLRAMDRAAVYMPSMEQVFARQGMPIELTRLPFVESMFNLAARSKVGASGIWQFMPGTAKKYMSINRLVDERNNPIKAAWGATRLLGANHDQLGSWPLAITAYNHGGGGMSRAVKQVGSSDLSQVIQYYRSPSFGFASRNFYAEFRAAVKTYNRLSRTHIPAREAQRAQLVTLGKPMSVAQLLRVTPLDKDTLAKHNPCLTKDAFNALRNSPLPRGFQIVVPTHMASKVRVAVGSNRQPSRGRNSL